MIVLPATAWLQRPLSGALLHAFSACRGYRSFAGISPRRAACRHLAMVLAVSLEIFEFLPLPVCLSELELEYEAEFLSDLESGSELEAESLSDHESGSELEAESLSDLESGSEPEAESLSDFESGSDLESEPLLSFR